MECVYQYNGEIDVTPAPVPAGAPLFKLLTSVAKWADRPQISSSKFKQFNYWGNEGVTLKVSLKPGRCTQLNKFAGQG